MKITISMAERVAEAALIKTAENLEALGEKVKQYTYDIARNSIPSVVMKAFQHDKSYIKTAASERFQYVGRQDDTVQDYEYYKFPKGKVLPSWGFATVSKAEYQQLQLYKTAFNSATTQYKKELETMVSVLLSLRTVKIAKQELPEISHLWPAETVSTALVVDTSKAKEILSRL